MSDNFIKTVVLDDDTKKAIVNQDPSQSSESSSFESENEEIADTKFTQTYSYLT